MSKLINWFFNSPRLARHRYQFDQTCMECHDVSNPGGADNTSFCSNSGCHATEWKFVGLDAPAIWAMVEPPAVPGSGQPQAVPHPIAARTDCTICHGANAVLSFSADHANYDRSLCTLCYEPTLVEAGQEVAAIEVPGIPHLIKGQEDRCLDCHGPDAIVPCPDNHAAWNPDSCLFCHSLAEESEEVSTEDKPKRPRIPHTLEGREDCLFCHSLDGIVPFSPNHEDRDLEDCTVCHKPEKA